MVSCSPTGDEWFRDRQRISCRLIAFVVLAMAPFQAAPGEDVQPYGHRDHFITDAEPQPVQVKGNPLEYAGRRIGIDARAFELPRAEEGSYRLACRFPVIDEVMNQPLRLKSFAESNSLAINGAHAARGILAVDEVVALLRGVPAMERSAAVGVDANSPANAPANDEDAAAIAELNKELESLPLTLELRQALVQLVTVHLQAARLAAAALRDLSTEDLAFLAANPGYYLAPDGKTMPSITGNVDSHFRFIEIARRVRLDETMAAAQILGCAVDEYLQATSAANAGGFFTSDTPWSETIRLQTPAGLVMIAGAKADVHEEDAALLIDLGGDDVYRNNAGGCDGSSRRIALCIDHTGDDRYESGERNYVQGFGFLGAGMLVDLVGDDRYEAHHFSQAAAILGVGVLLDKSGDDSFVAQTFCQGAGMFGAGVLLETAGEDFYDCATLGQGAGTTLGIGVVSDLSGDDRYHLFIGAGKDAMGDLPGYGQGGGLSWRHNPWRGRLTAYGGIGMLLDAAGNDRYRAGAWCSQAGSYMMSLGVLVDDGGNDHYTCGTGQGSGIHVTSAVFIDRDGHDVYESGFRGGGSGGDRSPCLFIDYHGNDIYRSQTSSFGTGVKPLCYSLFIDYEGEDAYICGEPAGRILFNNWDSFGGVWPESAPHLWPYGMCLDLGGTDDYQVRNRANNSERHSFGHGLHLDIEWDKGDVIGEVPTPLAPYRMDLLPESTLAGPNGDDLRQLMDADVFVRFGAVGRINSAGVAVLDELVAALRESEHRSLNRDLLECLHALLASGAVGVEETPAIVALLHARDEEVRKIVADNCGIWRLAAAKDALLAALEQDISALVRRNSCASLLALEATSALPLVRKLARADPDADVRRVAMIYLGRVRDDTDIVPLLIESLTSDPSPFVRVYAADGLSDLEDERALPALLEAASSFDAYLARAASKGLARLYRIEGIEGLIRSLDFPSIDAFWNYGYNVSNFIETYSGHTLPEAERYEREDWTKWFNENRERIDMKATVDAHRAFTQLERDLQGLAPKDQVKRLENFLTEHPGTRLAEGRLATLLNQLAWNMVTAAEGTPERDPATGLRYAIRCVELDAHPNNVDTLAEAYLANGDIEKSLKTCQDALLLHPGEKMFLDRIERCQKLLQTEDGE